MKNVFEKTLKNDYLLILRDWWYLLGYVFEKFFVNQIIREAKKRKKRKRAESFYFRVNLCFIYIYICERGKNVIIV